MGLLGSGETGRLLADMTEDVVAEVVEVDKDEDALFARAVGKGAIIGLPIAFLVITLAIWLGTGQPFTRSLTASILPSVLTGVFGGGFGGMVVATIRSESSH